MKHLGEAVRRWLALVWNDEKAARALLRGGFHAFGLSGVAFADKLALVIHAPGLVNTIRIAAVCCAFFAGNVVAGQTNPKPDTAPAVEGDDFT